MGYSVFPAPSSGGLTAAQPQWVLLGSDVTTGSAATRTISNIPQTYSALKIIASGYYSPGSNYDTTFRLNNDNGGYYSLRYTAWGMLNGSTAQSIGGRASQDSITSSFGDNSRANNRNYFEAIVYNYTSTTQPKIFEYRYSGRLAYSNQEYACHGDGFYNPPTQAAITSVVLNGGASDYTIGSANQTFGFFIYGAL